jgi:septal ring factor EnvC (AmiA/AmiB activator)
VVDKTELQLKAAEKRLDNLERTLDTLKKEVGTINIGPLLSDLKTIKARIDTLDTLVKGLGVQMVLKKDLSTAKQLDANDRDKENKAMQLRVQAESMAMADKQRKEVLAMTAQMRADNEKLIAGIRIDVIEGRLKALESRVR